MPLCGSTDGRSSTWPALSSLPTRAGIPGGFHTICSKSRNTMQMIYNKRFMLQMTVFKFHLCRTGVMRPL